MDNHTVKGEKDCPTNYSVRGGQDILETYKVLHVQHSSKGEEDGVQRSLCLYQKI